ncbi:MAG TPA: hypothetical protein VJC03_08880 [bacterium]|nr:hypothetical protein [bacterium]
MIALVLFSPRALYSDNPSEIIHPKPVEKYTYEAVPQTGGSSRKIESILVEILSKPGEIVYISQITGHKKEESFRIETDSMGELRIAERKTFFSKDKTVNLQKIERRAGKLFLSEINGGKTEQKEYVLSGNRKVAVDASLLILMRLFPFGTDSAENFFMMDFSRKSITVTVRPAGIETVNVPAGEFECYRMEVTVNLFLLKPRMLYWITKKPPHFLVRHEGKRGPFTPSYRTVLVSYE